MGVAIIVLVFLTAACLVSIRISLERQSEDIEQLKHMLSERIVNWDQEFQKLEDEEQS